MVIADRIKGIIVEIGGDTVGLDKALKTVNKTSRTLQTELKDVQKLLKFDPNNVELIAQKQKLLNDQIENSTSKLNQLKSAEAQVQAQFDKGDIKAEQYRAFQREVQDTQQALRYFQSALQDTQSEQDSTQQSTQRLNNLFRVTGKSAQDYADILGTRLVRAIQNGSASSADLQKAFQKVGADAIGAKGDIQSLIKSIDKVGSASSSVNKVRQEIQGLKNDADKAADSSGGIFEKLTGSALGAVGALGGISALVTKAMSTANLDTVIHLSMDVSPEAEQAVKDSVNNLVSYGEDEATALEAVRRQWALNGEAGVKANNKIIQSAGAIAKAIEGIDLIELIQESDEFGAAIGTTQQKALEMQYALLKAGFPPEQLDIMSEYGDQLHNAGYNALQIQGIFAAGIKTKSWNIDNLLDGLKEGRVRLTELGSGVDAATAKVIQGTGISSEQLQKWGKDVAAGGAGGQKAIMDVAIALSKIEDPAKRNAVGVQLFGTMWEDQGKKITDTLVNANQNIGNTTENTKQMNNAIATVNSDPLTRVNQALSDMNTALQPVYSMVAQFVGVIADWVSRNPELAATLIAVVVAIGLVTTAIVAWSAATFVLDTALLPIIGTVAAIVVGIAALVWAIIYVKNHMDDWKKKAAELAKSMIAKFNELKDGAIKKIQDLSKSISGLWDKIIGFFKGKSLFQIGVDIVKGLIKGLLSMANPLGLAAKGLAYVIEKSVKKKAKAKSPSLVMMGIGEDYGKGLEIGLGNTMSQIQKMSEKMALASIPRMPEQKTINAQTNPTANKNMTVNIHSPKALDIKESNKLLQRTMNNMSLLW